MNQTPLPPAQGDAPAPPADVYVEKYRLLRDRIKAIQDRHDAELRPYNEAKAQIESHLTSILLGMGANSCKTDSGTFYLSTTSSYKLDDPEQLRAWAEANNRPDVYENRPSKSVLDDMVSRGMPLPPGISVSSFTRLNVKK